MIFQCWMLPACVPTSSRKLSVFETSSGEAMASAIGSS